MSFRKGTGRRFIPRKQAIERGLDAHQFKSFQTMTSSPTDKEEQMRQHCPKPCFECHGSSSADELKLFLKDPGCITLVFLHLLSYHIIF
ncbi:hypothetical protein HBI25_186310 [Parastagonospora nodorum]|nr:hypothetical protein HBH51_156730 [Parastagonospora nodorum]KAH4022871.1 hypothetical protein HBI09_168900 [Parastagonospora nodorum]KAH4070409.1 hypothetical protein HBH50_098550 [Parastagonospora nodorum]KAH4080818.1 hypothetical protein HBH46_228650 [Parastagonospora nodorum]KAH4090973.1 hypothetical protein HBH48_102330 [Parastagonospora nodorum]